MKKLMLLSVLLLGVSSAFAAEAVKISTAVTKPSVNPAIQTNAQDPVNAQKYNNCACSGCQVGANKQCYDKYGNAIPSSN